MKDSTKVQKYLRQGEWKALQSLFNSTEKKDGLKVAILTSEGKIEDGTWNYSTNHLKCKDGLEIVAWKSWDEYSPLPNFFQKIFGKKSD